jgi:hypothetical protein
MEYIDEESNQTVFLNNFPILVILNSGYADHEDQKKILAKYGTYTHFEPVKSVGGLPGPFHVPGAGAPHMGMSHMEKQRVTVEDMSKYSISVRGNRGDTVSLYRKIGNV